jgi:hypothetical protein
MTREEFIKKIKSKGYWEVRVTPLKFDANLIPDRKILNDMVSKAQIRLRGWYYPHIGRWNETGQQVPSVGSNYIEGGSNWDTQIEFWRFYQSGQFIQIHAMYEDYMEGSDWFKGRTDIKEIKPGEALNTGAVTYGVSEILAFIEALTRQGVYDNGAKIEISLKGTEGRVLKIFDWNKVPLFWEYKCGTPSVDWSKEVTKDEILNDYKKIAIDAVVWIFQSFNWMDSPRGVFEEDQKKLFERRW